LLAFTSLLVLTAPAVAALKLAVPDAERLVFDVLMDGDREIGTHIIDIVHNGADTTVQITVDLDVKFGFLTVFRYNLELTERWRAGRFESLDARSERDGRIGTVTARRTENGIALAGPAGSVLAPPEALPATHWNRALMDQAVWINGETGVLIHVTREDLGRVQLALPAGPVIATRIRQTGTVPIDYWYDDQDRLVWLRFQLDGRVFDYRPRPPTTSAGVG
jgi:hypothetical protein